MGGHRMGSDRPASWTDRCLRCFESHDAVFIPAAPPRAGEMLTAATSTPRDTAGPALSVHGLSKRFGDRVAFQDVSFEIAYGEVFGFLGPNGAGKTTTVRTLGTLTAPTSGTAVVAGPPLPPAHGAA